jgi:hypothetical protein
MRSIEAVPGRATEGNSQSNFEGINLGFQDTGQQRHEDSDRIYGRGVWPYIAAGWRGVLPLPPAAKSPPPKGFTGYDGAWPTDEQSAAWSKNEPADANLAIRVNYGVIGIDVDAYGNKAGGRTLEEAEKRWGPLPPTFRSSSRGEDAVSGIRVYRVPEGVLFRPGIKFDDLGIGHVDIIQPHHRHITAWPSIHPNGCQYRWYGLDGLVLPEGPVPRVQDLSELPPNWVGQLSRDAVRDEAFDGSALNRTAAQRERIDEAVYQRLIASEDNDVPDQVVAARLDRALADLTSGTKSRYDTTRDHIATLMRLKAIGRLGVPSALAQLYPAYVLEVTDTRPQIVAEAEFLRLTEGAAALVAGSSPNRATTEQANGDNASSDAAGATFTDGASFILDIPDTIPALWGDDQRVLWSEGESLMICGPPGLGKTTLAGMLISAQLGGMGDIGEQVLGLTVAPQPGKILYLAMDRPSQIARSLHRQFTEIRRDVLRERLVVWQGPPPADIAANPPLLAELAELAGASVVYLDSLKDAAVGLSEDTVGAGYNRARQLLLKRGVQMAELHHSVKRSSGSVDDVFGSVWLISGAGSIIMMTGQPGDPVVGFRHIRQPAQEVGPLMLSHDESSGTISILSSTDPVALAKEAGDDGITAKGLAVVMFDTADPSRADIEKARRHLDRLTSQGSLIRCKAGTTGGSKGGTQTTWVAA